MSELVKNPNCFSHVVAHIYVAIQYHIVTVVTPHSWQEIVHIYHDTPLATSLHQSVERNKSFHNINPYLRMDFHIISIWVSPLSFLEASGVFFFNFIQFFNENSQSKQKSSRWDAALCGVTFGAILFAYVP